MARYLLSAAADADVEQIAAWIARDNVAAARKWIDQLGTKFENLSNLPGSGTDQSKIRKGLRSSPFGNYLVFYRKYRDGIFIYRIIHGARNYRRLF
jgi:toxin ParE1/3/4